MTYLNSDQRKLITNLRREAVDIYDRMDDWFWANRLNTMFGGKGADFISMKGLMKRLDLLQVKLAELPTMLDSRADSDEEVTA